MNKWGNSYREDQQTSNIAANINHQSTAYELLGVTEFVQKVKARSSKITKKIIEPAHRHILLQFAQIAINPKKFMEREHKVLDKKMTHGAIQVLTNLSQQFIEAIFDEDDTNEDQVIQIQKEYPILNAMFKLITPEVQQTGLAYLSKIITPFIYQRPQQMMKFISPQIIAILVQYLWSSSMAQLVTKILQAEGQNDFFQKQKKQFYQTFIKVLSEIDNQNKYERIVQNIAFIIDSLVQKHEDRYERSKYATLIKSIVEDSSNFQFILVDLKKYDKNHVIKTQLLNCLYLYLRIHLNGKQGSKINEQDMKQSQNIKVNQVFINKIRDFIIQNLPSAFVQELRRQLVYYYKVVKTIITLSPGLAEEILNKQFLNSTLKLMREDPHNNILHNFQKDVIVSGVRQSLKICEIVQNEIGFDDALRSNVTQNNSRISYETQLFLIGQAVKSRADQAKIQSQLWNDVDETLANKRKFYSVVIGGKPRSNSQKWNDFDDDQMILKPLEQKKQEKQEKQEKQVEKPKKQKHQYTMVTKLDELEGTQVLSQEEDEDPFNQKQTANSHYIDDIGMPDLPLDSDRSQEGEGKNLQASNDDIPELLMQNSGTFQNNNKVDVEDLPETLNQNSQEYVNNTPDSKKNDESKLPDRVNSIVAIDLQNPSGFQNINMVTSNATDSPFSKQSKKQKQSDFTSDLKIQSIKKPNELDLIQNQVNQLTVSVNIADEFEQQIQNKSKQQVVEQKQEQVSKQNQTDLNRHQSKQKEEVEIKNAVPHREQIEFMIKNKYNVSLIP